MSQESNENHLEKNVTKPPNYPTLEERVICGPELHFRQGTSIPKYVINFALNEGGLGDYLNYMSAILWAAKNCPWIEGRIVVVKHFIPLFRLILETYGVNWELVPGEDASTILRDQTPIIGPEIQMDGRNVNPQLLNPIGAHLIDLGFAYYTNRCPAPADATLPYLDLRGAKLPHKVRHLRGRYVVITTGAMTPSRFVSGKHMNPLIDYILAEGFTPVFLGKRQTGGHLNATFAADIEYQKGLDLRDQTDLITAAAVMANSVGVLGIDNGLLHLAACTDANVLFGYSIAGPDQRAPRRNWGMTFNLAITKKDLACASCQSNIKILLGHTFHKCLYEDLKCIDILFIDQVDRWTSALAKCFDEFKAKGD